VNGDSRARLFVALELPDQARDALAQWRARLPPPVTLGLRPVAAEALHVTLCFLGWHSPDEVESIAAACRIAGDDAPPSLTLGDAVWLPRRRPRALAVKLADPGERLARTQARLANALAAGGWYRPEQRPFLPHVTVARVKAGPGAGRSAISPPPQLAFHASRVVLYRSRLARTGALYEALSAVELGG
jgi:RNA 2',3'-cyclic 3'-phosphodiesterase